MASNTTTTTQDSKTGSYTKTEPNFDDISLNVIHFNKKFNLNKAAASQLVKGFESMGEDKSTTIPNNDYQKYLYPMLVDICKTIVDAYCEYFLTDLTSAVKRQVYGANLNGNTNTGCLDRTIRTAGVDTRRQYFYAQFGELLQTLMQRIKFIAERNVDTISRYVTNTEEREHFLTLQKQASEYYGFLDLVRTQWKTTVQTARSNNSDVQPKQKRPYYKKYTQNSTENSEQTQTRTKYVKKHYTSRNNNVLEETN